MRKFLFATLCLAVTTLVAEENKFKDVEFTSSMVSDGIYMLQGAGGNVGLSVGEDGVLLIDDDYAELSEKLKKAVAEITDSPVRFVLNTHWHFDHSGGNETFGKHGATIVAHDNVHKRMSVDTEIKPFGQIVPASPDIALPVITFNDRMTFHLNGEEIQVFYAGNAHTDGDSAVYFVESNVIHTGDVYSSDRYPFIDTNANGSIDGMILAVEKLLKVVDARTKIIPGHGPISSKQDLNAYLENLKTFRSRMQKLIDEGKTMDEAVALKPYADFDPELGNGFLSPEAFIKVMYFNLSQ